jgi:hypothetical protein
VQMIQTYEEVSLFNLEWFLLLSLPDNYNDMIDEDITYILLQINMSVPPESRRCVLIAFACLHVYIIYERRTHHVTCCKNYRYLLKHMVQVLKCQVSIWFLTLTNNYSFESKVFHFLLGTICSRIFAVKKIGILLRQIVRIPLG